MKCFLGIFCLLLVVVSVSVSQESPGPASEVSAEEQQSGVAATQAEPQKASEYPDPNLIPYRTEKSPLVHLLSLPAKVWHVLWLPLGETVIWAERNRVPQKVSNFFFLNDERTAAVFPMISLGGNTGAGGGLRFFHHNLFDQRKRLEAQFLFSTPENNVASIAYQDSSLFGSSFYFDLTGEYFNDSDENLYIEESVPPEKLDDSSIGSNNSDLEDETSYATEEVNLLANFGYGITDRIGLGGVFRFRRTDVDSGDGAGGDLFPGVIPGAGVTSLVSVGSALTFNFTHGWPRTLSGPLLRLSYTYNREINGDRFEFNRFTVEAQQFVPIPFLAHNRRLAIRGIFEKIDRIGDKQLPFYELSLLGDAQNLRGFDQNRFRGRGLLLFNFEYRFPVWDTWDAVIFVDEGQVYDDLDDIALNRFHTSVGTGLRFMTPTGFLMRVEVARSSEQWRALFQIVPNF